MKRYVLTFLLILVMISSVYGSPYWKDYPIGFGYQITDAKFNSILEYWEGRNESSNPDAEEYFYDPEEFHVNLIEDMFLYNNILDNKVYSKNIQTGELNDVFSIDKYIMVDEKNYQLLGIVPAGVVYYTAFIDRSHSMEALRASGIEGYIVNDETQVGFRIPYGQIMDNANFTIPENFFDDYSIYTGIRELLVVGNSIVGQISLSQWAHGGTSGSGMNDIVFQYNTVTANLGTFIGRSWHAASEEVTDCSIIGDWVYNSKTDSFLVISGHQYCIIDAYSNDEIFHGFTDYDWKFGSLDPIGHNESHVFGYLGHDFVVFQLNDKDNYDTYNSSIWLFDYVVYREGKFISATILHESIVVGGGSSFIGISFWFVCLAVFTGYLFSHILRRKI